MAYDVPFDSDPYLAPTAAARASGDPDISWGTSYYVATDGNDANAGTLDAPFLTIGAAQTAVAVLVAAGLTAPVTVYIRGGTYRISSTLAFTVLDSGTAAFPIRYKAYNNETPIVNGSIIVSGSWAVHSGSIQYVDIPGQADFRTLVVDGVRAIRARTPNVGSYYLMDDPFVPDVVTKDHFQIDVADLPADLTGSGIETVTFGGFIVERMKYSSTSDTNHINLTADSSPGYNLKPTYGRYYWENALAFIDQAGEWYFDPAIDRLYYWPRAGETLDGTSVVEIPQIDTAISVDGVAASFPQASSAGSYDGDFTVALWFKTGYDNPSGADVFWEKHLIGSVHDSNGWAVTLREQNRTGWKYGFIHLTHGGTNVDANGISGLNDDAWHHVAVAVDNTNNEARIYVDGVESTYYLGGNTISGDPNTSAPRIGGSGTASADWDGEMDDILLLDGAIADADAATAIMNKTGTANYGDYTKFLWMDGEDFTTNGTQFLYAQSHRLYLSGGSPINSEPTLVAGQTGYGNCYSFDGVYDHIRLDQPPGTIVRNLHIDGITFTGFDWPDVGTGWTDFGDNYNTAIRGVISQLYTQDCSVKNCTIYNCGQTGILFDQCKNSIANYNYIHNVGYEAISCLGWGNVVDGDWYSPSEINGNHIHDIGFAQPNTRAIYCYQCGNGCEINDNHIHDLPRMAISVFGSLDGLHLSNGNITIANNVCYDCVQEVTDAGAIYINGYQPEATIRNNHIFDILRTTSTNLTPQLGQIRGIYLDQGSAAITVTQNLVYRCASQCINLNEVGPDNIITNNILVDPQDTDGNCLLQTVRDTVQSGSDGATEIHPIGNTIDKNVYYFTGANHGYGLTAKSVTYLATATEPISTIENNFYRSDSCRQYYDNADGGGTPGWTTLTLAQMLADHQLETTPVVGDPLFADYATDDFTMDPATSTVFDTGFENFYIPAIPT